MSSTSDEVCGLVAFFMTLFLNLGVVVVTLVPWLWNLVWCGRLVNEHGGAIVLMIVGLFVPPIGWLHGVSIMLGFPWI